MNSYETVLAELHSIAARLASIDAFQGSAGLEDAQVQIVRLIQASLCPPLKLLAPLVAHSEPSQVLHAWQKMVVEGLEPQTPSLPSVAAIRARADQGHVEVISTNQPVRMTSMNPWVDHARQVVGALIAKVESEAWSANSDQLRQPPSRTSAGRSPGQAHGTREERRHRWLAEAMLMVRNHPDYSDARVAELVGINKSQLSRSPEYRTAAALARRCITRSGNVLHTDGVRSIEAVDDTVDPNRKASWQSEEEEDLDDRIDREMASLQRATQRNATIKPRDY
jgi:hypothetical protein